MARFPEVDFDMVDYVGDYLYKTYGLDELPIGAIKNERGMVTLTGT